MNSLLLRRYQEVGWYKLAILNVESNATRIPNLQAKVEELGVPYSG